MFFDEQWQGYFLPDQLDFYDKTERKKRLMTQIILLQKDMVSFVNILEITLTIQKLSQKKFMKLLRTEKNLLKNFGVLINKYFEKCLNG